MPNEYFVVADFSLHTPDAGFPVTDLIFGSSDSGFLVTLSHGVPDTDFAVVDL